MLTLITWLRSCLLGLSTAKLLFFSLFFPLWREVIMCSPNFRRPPPWEQSIYINDLEFFCRGGMQIICFQTFLSCSFKFMLEQFGRVFRFYLTSLLHKFFTFSFIHSFIHSVNIEHVSHARHCLRYFTSITRILAVLLSQDIMYCFSVCTVK